MGISLSGGPWQYNRFSSLDEGSKPDYLDFDGDGNKKEPMKKALKEKGKKPVSEEKKELPDFIKKKVEEKKGKKDRDCGCDETPCECDDKEKKEEFTSIVKEVIAEGHDLSDYAFDELYSLYEAMVDGPRKDAMKKKGYMAKSSRDRANAFNIGTRGDTSPGDPEVKSRGGRADNRMGISDRGKGNAAKRRMNKEETELQEMDYQAPPKPPAEVRQDKQRGAQQGPEFAKLGAVAAMAAKKKKDKKDKKAPPVKRVFESSEFKESVLEYLLENNYANNPVSAEVLFNHMSEEWLESIEKSFG